MCQLSFSMRKPLISTGSGLSASLIILQSRFISGREEGITTAFEKMEIEKLYGRELSEKETEIVSGGSGITPEMVLCPFFVLCDFVHDKFTLRVYYDIELTYVKRESRKSGVKEFY